MSLTRLLLTAVLAVSAFAADVAGKWKSTVEGPNGSLDIVFDFKVDGQKLSGTSTSPMGEATITEGTLEGDKITFTVEAGDFKVSHKGTVSGNEMKLTVEFNDQSFDMKATRVTS